MSKISKPALILLLCNLTLCLLAAPASLYTRDAASGALNIDNGTFRFSLFPGHMLPVWMKNHDGAALPQCRFVDRMTLIDSGKLYFLDQDLYAQTVILADTPERLLIEKRGTYCSDPQHAVPGNVRVTYAYLIERGKPEVTLTLTVERDDETPAEVRFFHPTWDGNTQWKQLEAKELPSPVCPAEDTTNPGGMYGPFSICTITDGTISLKTGGNSRFYFNRTNHGSFLLGNIRDVWKTRSLTMQVTFTLETP